MLLLLLPGQFPLLHSVTVQALALSGCGDWDNPAGGAVGLLCLAAMGSKTDNLAAVGSLAQSTKGARHVIRGLCGANQHRAAFGCGAVLWGVHGDNHGHR
jgi:hypothetical protein